MLPSTVTAASRSQPPIVADELLTGAFLSRLQKYALRRLGDDASAKDAVQATFEVLLASAGRFRGHSSYLTYATGILRHKIGDVLRERGRYVSLSDDGEDDAAFAGYRANEGGGSGGLSGPERQAHLRGLREALGAVLSEITPRSRQLLLMREGQGLDGAEIARRLGLTTNNTWAVLHRARRQLRVGLLARGYGADGAGHA